MIYAAMAFAWISSFVVVMSTGFESSAVINGACFGYVVWKSPEASLAGGLWYFLSGYVLVLVIFIFCYGKILTAIRRQARVMAGHSTTRSSTAQTQSNQIQSSVIKTMILVCAFYAVAWLPEKIYILLMFLGQDLTLHNSVYYVTMFLGFLYICANPFIYATKFDPVRHILAGLILHRRVSVAADGGVQLQVRPQEIMPGGAPM